MSAQYRRYISAISAQYQRNISSISAITLRDAPVLSFRHLVTQGYVEAANTNQCRDAIQVQMWVAMVTEQAVPNRSHLHTWPTLLVWSPKGQEHYFFFSDRMPALLRDANNDQRVFRTHVRPISHITYGNRY
jgi:hypothetical protein